MYATEHAPNYTFKLLEHRHAFAEIVERGTVIRIERRRVIPPHFEREVILLSENAPRCGDRFAPQCLGFFEVLQMSKGRRVVVMNLRVGHQENVSQFSGDVRRQHFSLFAQDKTEKHAWHTTLNTVTNSSREWAYVGHEIKDSCAYITGKKK